MKDNNKNNKSESLLSKLKTKLSGTGSQEVYDLSGHKLGELSPNGELILNGSKVNAQVIIDKE